MQKEKVIALLILIACLVFVIASMAFTPAVSAREKSADLTQDMVEEQYSSLLKDSDLFETYNLIATLPMNQRVMVYHSFTSQKKSDIWRLHLIRHLTNHPEFTTEQRKVILDGIAVATPKLFEIPQNGLEWSKKVHKPLERLRKRALELFPREVAAVIFAKLGASDLVTPLKQPTCECSTVSDWCWWGTSCAGGGCWWTSGCGTFWMYGCTGMCRVLA